MFREIKQLQASRFGAIRVFCPVGWWGKMSAVNGETLLMFANINDSATVMAKAPSTVVGLWGDIDFVGLPASYALELAAVKLAPTSDYLLNHFPRQLPTPFVVCLCLCVCVCVCMCE